MNFRVLVSLLMMISAAMSSMAAVPPTKLTETITWELTDDGVLKVYGTGEIPDFKKGTKNAWHQENSKLNGIGDFLFAIKK